MKKRILAMLLAAVLIIALVGCGKNKREIIRLTLSTEDSEAILKAAGITLPDVEDVPAAGSTVKFYSWYDPFHNYSEDEIINTGYFTFSEKYGCEIDYIESDYGMRFDGLANLVLSGESPDFYPCYAEIFPNYVLKGVFGPVDDYMDYNDPLWKEMQNFADTYFRLGDKHYAICTDATFGNVCAYNRRVIFEWGFDDPAELFYNDEWTWDVFYDMCVEFSSPDDDRYALDSFAYSVAIMRSTGASIANLDPETGRFVSNLDDPRLERAANLLYDLTKNDCCYPKWKNGGIRNGVNGSGIKEGLCLFWLSPSWAFTGPVDDMSDLWGDITAGEVMFVPAPRDDNGDGKYYIETVPSGYCLVIGAKNPEGAALLAACERFKIIDPTVISIDRKQLETTYHWNQDMLDMWDVCYDLSGGSDIIFNYMDGYGSKLQSVLDRFDNLAHCDKSQAISWAQAKENYGDQLIYYIDDLNTQMDEYIKSNS